MLILARLLGFVIILIGASVLIHPKTFKSIMAFWREDRHIYLAGALRLLFGIIFLLIAPTCRLSTVVSVLGVLMLIGGALIFIMGIKRLQKIFDWWEKKPLSVMRFMGIAALALGVLIIYSI